MATLSLAATGCSFSTVDPDQSVRISGRALDAAGKPLAKTKVLLFKQADIGEVVFGSILAVGTLATICLVPDAPAICRKARTATTDADGRYAFDLKGSDTQGTLGTASTINVVFANRRSSTTVSFIAKEGEVDLPDARLWNASPRVSQGGGDIRLSFAALPAAAGRKPTYSARLFEAKGQSALWTQPVSGTSGTVDARILEDQRGSVAAGADASLSGSSGAADVRGHYLSARIPVRATSGTPLSRGRRCAAVTGTAPAKDGAFSRCGATDGNLDQPARLRGKGGVVTGAVVDLGSVRPVDLVVARGFSGQVLVELSDDGRTYRTVATNSGFAVALDVPGGQRARYVRLRSPSGVDQSLSAELSVW
ncbi:discoidin domain-containing protein [Nocardioides marmoriginsengisoli]|uniref:Discoidin domain-containing protein n=1 Tax=Nocardioides marmoriginsengisoli TaxID=661483 RepID=A0A3N0CDM0_9ACTN|nr:discoidin domain-containing protein [Nocardioides marmoriginsengisoli]RNL61331.1 discoidin domain-containing protein [Nocardioides marmoriginsengisoli]